MDIISQLQHALSYGFIQRALLAGCFIALSCAFLGVFLVLRRFSLIGDGIAHVAFAAVALALLLHAEPLVVALPVVALASLLILELSTRVRVFADTAIGLVSSFAVACAVMMASLGKGFNVDLFSYLFGNILTVSAPEVKLAVGLSLVVMGLTALFYHDLFAVTFDEDHARASGVKVAQVNRVLILLTAVTVVLGIRLVGTLLISSLIILPAATALQWVRGFRGVIMTAAVLSLAALMAGIAISYVFSLPAGASIVLVNFTFFITGAVVNSLRR